MDLDGTRFAAITETTSFLHYFSGLPDHRQAGKVDYPLPEVLLLILLAVLAGAEAFTDIARFGERKIELLRRFRPYVNGTPSHDHLGDIFATLDARAFQLCFVAWVAASTNTPAEVIAVDGKTSRRSYQKKGSKEAIHIVSAFAARQRIVLGQVKVNEKSNEIVAIPALLDMMSIEGAVVTIDAIGCQRDIAAKIIEKKAGRQRDAPLHHLAGDAGQRGRPDDPRALGHRKLLALGHGHGLSRRRVPRQNRQRTSQLRDLPAHRLQPHPQGTGQRFHPPPTQNRRLGRPISRKPHRSVISFTRFPCTPSGVDLPRWNRPC